MVARRPGRPAWLPAVLTWIPLLVGGMWLTTGARITADAVGGGNYNTGVVLPAAQDWLLDAPFGWLGLLMLVAGIAMVGLYIWSPDPMRWRFVITEFPAFRAASWLFFLLAAMSFVKLGSPLVDDAAGRLEWRFITTLRTDLWNQLFAWVFLSIGVGCNIAAYGAAWRIMPWPLPGEIQSDQEQDDGDAG